MTNQSVQNFVCECRYLAALFFLVIGGAIHAQDSTFIFTFDAFQEMVLAEHPMSQSADLQREIGINSILGARGAFDPKILADVSQKYFKGSKYYSRIDGGLEIPTSFGLIFDAGYEQNEGVFLNPEANNPPAGLYYAGVKLPLGQGLFIDERRAVLQQAKLFQQITELERTLRLNDLMYSAGVAYWEWFKSFHNRQIYQEALALAENRLNFVRNTVRVGDEPPIDTVEARIQYQNRKIGLQQAALEYINARNKLNIFLWAGGRLPLELSNNAIPPDFDNSMAELGTDLIYDSLQQLINVHPIIQQTNLKLEQLGIERDWKREQLKPEINLKYNALAEPVGGNPFAEYSAENYTWGIELKSPLFLRKERAGVQLTNLKIQETEFNLINKREQLAFKAMAAYNTWDNSLDQINIYRQTVSDYLRLLEGERQLFTLGESSLFLVNARELGYINANLKLISLITDNQKASLETNYALGILNQ